jgi:hypothetical protein
MGAIVFIMFICNMALAQSPPFSSITIFGETIDLYNKVSLFEKGSSKTPFKTEYISSYDGKYSIEVDIPDDMRRHDDYLYTDMRFWNDKNDNGRRDPGEPISQCHFIIWIPSYNKILFQVYKGPKYEIDSSHFRYDYKD